MNHTSILKLKLYISIIQEKVWKVDMYCQFSRWWQLKMLVKNRFFSFFYFVLPSISFTLLSSNLGFVGSYGIWVLYHDKDISQSKRKHTKLMSTIQWHNTKFSNCDISNSKQYTRYFYLQYFGRNRLWTLLLFFKETGWSLSTHNGPQTGRGEKLT